MHPWPGDPGRPLNIAHRGASAHATENTLDAFAAAAALGADMWELDVRLSADGEPVVAHDDALAPVFGVGGSIAALAWAEIRARAPRVPHLDEVIALAGARGQALYVEIKSPGAGPAAADRLRRADFAPAVLGSFDVQEVRRLADVGCPYPLSVLVPLDADPFACAAAADADIVHLCWERGGARPQDLVRPALLRRADELGLGVVLWHEERADVLADLRALPVLGICTNNPEMMAGFGPVDALGIALVCHRGINHLAPENTLAAARLCFDQGAAYLELDVRESADGEIVVIHDSTLERTTDGTGRVAAATLAELRALDAGSWFSPFHAGARIPTLGEVIELARAHGRRLYIENKCVDAEKLVASVAEAGFLEHSFFWSPDPGLLERMRAVSPGARIKANPQDYGSLAEMRARLDPAIAEIPLERYAAEAPRLAGSGIVPMMQYFGDDPAVFDRIVEMRPPMLNLDRSDLLLAAARRRA